MYVHQTPVGAPAPIILVAGLILFGLLVMIKSGGARDEAEPNAPACRCSASLFSS